MLRLHALRKSGSSLVSACLPASLALCLALALAPPPAIAQTTPTSTNPSLSTDAQQPGSISGTIIDTDGDAIAGAQVLLSGPGIPPNTKLTADRDGYFSFVPVTPGIVKLTIASDGFATTAKTFAVHPGENLETPDITLPVASANVDVEVSLTPHDIAEEDVHIEEQQRIAGFIPNFYVVYNWNAPPLSANQKFKLAFRNVVDPANFIISGIFAGAEQATNGFAGYGQGARGYFKRYGASVADGTTGSLLGGALFPVLLRQDPRYFYKGTGSVTIRTLYAIAAAFVCRGDNGKWQPNYSSVLGDVATGAISNTYYPPANRSGATATVEIGLLNAAEESISNIMEEFVFKHISTGVSKPTPGTPKP